MAVRKLVPCLDKGSYRRGCGVECGDAIFLDNIPETTEIRVVRSSLIHDLRYPVGERAENYIGMSGDPSNVCSAPVDVVILHIEDIFTGSVGP